jgi:hypothetical protein
MQILRIIVKIVPVTQFVCGTATGIQFVNLKIGIISTLKMKLPFTHYTRGNGPV